MTDRNTLRRWGQRGDRERELPHDGLQNRLRPLAGRRQLQDQLPAAVEQMPLAVSPAWRRAASNGRSCSPRASPRPAWASSRRAVAAGASAALPVTGGDAVARLPPGFRPRARQRPADKKANASAGSETGRGDQRLSGRLKPWVATVAPGAASGRPG